MAIHSLKISNFKGISESQDFKIRPITLFIGPNSSGKSSCIHALGCLAQTIKLGSSGNAIILDDEYAQLHLGRFIEVVHSRSYADAIELGINVGPTAGMPRFGLASNSELLANYRFRSTKKTQEIYLDRAQISAGAWLFDLKKKGAGAELVVAKSGKKYSAYSHSGLSFSLVPSGEPDDDFFQAYSVISNLNTRLARELERVLYLGPFRQPPLRRYPNRGSSPSEVGAMGESTVTLLANEYIRSTRSRPHHAEISKWLSVMGLAKTIELARLGSSDLFDVNVKLNDDVSLPIADLGYGLSQVLPVLTQCSFAPKDSTLLFEQPELHLHAGAAKMLAKIFIETANSKNAHIVAETHSPELFRQLMEEVRSGNLNIDDIVAYKVRREAGRSVIEKIQMEFEDGVLDVYDPWANAIDNP